AQRVIRLGHEPVEGGRGVVPRPGRTGRVETAHVAEQDVTGLSDVEARENGFAQARRAHHPRGAEGPPTVTRHRQVGQSVLRDPLVVDVARAVHADTGFVVRVAVDVLVHPVVPDLDARPRQALVAG